MKPNKYSKADVKEWQLHCLTQRLVQIIDSSEVHQQTNNAGNSGNHTADGGHTHPHTVSVLTPKVTAETAMVYLEPSFKSYAMAIARLFKQALFHKKGEHFILIG